MEKTANCKICSLFLLTFTFVLSLSILPVKAQTARVSINKKDATLEQVMNEIETQTRYLFVNENVKDLSQKVSINVVNKEIQETLDQLFGPLGITYRINKTSVFIKEPVAEDSQPFQIRGQVTNTAGAPVVGASVVVRGTTLGTSTDSGGAFILQLPPTARESVLEVNFLGCEPATAPVGGRTSFHFVLRESTAEIEQVVVTALGIKREQKALSYNVQQVKSEDITTIKDANFINSLSGKVAGVTINASSSGIGGASKVILRGNKSISQSSNALYVIDGIPMYNFGGGGGMEFDSRGATESIADINPEDIESMSVLTGAAAAALYGSNAANGAILITTKKGKPGVLKVTLSSNTEFLSPFTQPAFQNRYGTGSFGNRDGSGIYSWGERLTPEARYGYTPADFFDTGHVLTNAVTVSGGTDRNQTYFSAATVNSAGIIPNNEYDRYNFTFRNTSYLLKDKLRLDASGSYVYQKDQNMTNQGVYSNPLVSAYLFPRGEDFSLYKLFERYNPGTKIMEQFWGGDMEGGDLRLQNPYWIAHRNLRNTDKKRYMLSFTASYDILPWLNLTGRVRLDNSSSVYTQKLYATSNPTLTDGGSNGHYTEARALDSQTYGDVMVNINKSWDNWSLQANLGASVNNIKSDELSYRGPIKEDGLANVFDVFDLDDKKKRAEKVGFVDQTQAIFASVEVGWRQMLYMTVTGRNDWASQIAGSPNSSFFYPSVGLSWIPTSTWDLGKAVTYLKFRGSIASVGLPFPHFLTSPTYGYDGTGGRWKLTTHYPIGDLLPERTRTYELGFDARLWKRLSLIFSWYSADTYNQTFDPQLPPSATYTTIYLQTGHVRNTGVEATVGYNNQWRGFGWSSSFTFSWNRNEIIDLASGAVNPKTGEPLNLTELDIKGLGKAKYILKQGGTMGDLYTTSNLKFNNNGYIEVDKSGNLQITDEGDNIFIGSVFPKYNLAWRNDFRYKGLNLGLLFTGRIGGICYSATQANLDLYGVSEASAAARDAGGVLINGRETVDAQKWFQAIGSQSGLPQYYTYSATNFRLQELSLGYTLPRKWFRNKVGMTFSFVGRNLWMIYCKAPFDPETVASTGLSYQGIDYFMMPSLRSLGFSVKLEF